MLTDREVLDRKQRFAKRTRRELEAVAVNAAVELGFALRAIRDEDKWADDYRSFSAYCESGRRMSRQRAFQLIDIADFCDALGLTIEEASESALRPLVPLSKRNRAAAQRALDRATERAGGLQNLTRPLVERALAEEEGRAVPTECPRVDTATMHKLVQTGFSRLQCPGDSLREFHKGLQCLVAVVIEVARRELDRAHWLKDEHPNAFAQQCHDLGVEPERLLKEIEWLSTWLPEHHAPLLPASAKEKHSR